MPSTRGVLTESDGPCLPPFSDPVSSAQFTKWEGGQAGAAGTPGDPHRAGHCHHAHYTSTFPPTNTPGLQAGAQNREHHRPQLSTIQPSRSSGSLGILEVGVSPHFPDGGTESQEG